MVASVHSYRQRRIAETLLFVFIATGANAENAADSISQSQRRYRVHYSVEYVTEAEYDATLLADIYHPRGPGPFPTILMIHGGAWMSGNKAHVAWHARYAASSGYAVVAINYRLAPAAKFPAQLEDCRTALRWIAAHAEEYSLDRSRVAAYGYSAGAHLACLLGVTQPEVRDSEARQVGAVSQQASVPRLRAIVAGGTPCEFSWVPVDSERLSFWLGGSRASKPDIYRAASPTSYVDSQDPAVYLFHGEVDRVVPVSSAKTMKRLLDSHGVMNQLKIVDGSTHFGTFVSPEARRGAIEFLDQHLKSEHLHGERENAGTR